MSTVEEYDAIVIGGGLGGLSAAAVLAHSGEHVVVLEQGSGVGGYAHAFVRGGYTFDPAVHGIQSGQIVWNLLEYLGVDAQVPYWTSEHFYGAVFPDGVAVRTPAGWDAFVEANAETLGGAEAGQVRRFHAVLRDVLDEMAWLQMRADPRELGRMMTDRPTFARYRSSPLGDLFAEHVPSERARAVCGAAWPFLGLPPSQVSLLNYAQMLNTSLEGMRYPRGSFQRLADAFADAVVRYGGEVLVDTPVERILLDGDRVIGVRTSDGVIRRAPVVVSNADATTTLTGLLGCEHLPEPYLRRLRRMRLSLSAFTVFAATDLDLTGLGLAHETFLHPHWDHDDNWRDVLAGRPASAWMSNTTLCDPDLAPAGEHLAILTMLAPWDADRPWDQVKDQVADRLVRQFDRVVPGLSEHLTYRETGTPHTLHRFTRGHRGAMYGWANSPGQFANRRLPHATPVHGLYLAGHWTEEGCSSYRAITSGLVTAKQVLTHLGNEVGASLPRTFRHRTGFVAPSMSRRSRDLRKVGRA